MAEADPAAAASRRRRGERRRTSDAAGSLRETWRRLNAEQRTAAVAALLLIASTFGPFSFVEAAIVLTAAGVLALLRQRADRRRFHLPFGDGTVILAAGLWSGMLIVVRLFDRPLGQSVLALACAAILAGAGARERAKRPADDLPPPALPPDGARGAPSPPGGPRAPVRHGAARSRPGEDTTEAFGAGEERTARLATRDAPTEERPARRPPASGRPPPEDGEDAPRRPAGRP